MIDMFQLWKQIVSLFKINMFIIRNTIFCITLHLEIGTTLKSSFFKKQCVQA